jgi:hypothetical protein
LKKNLVITWPAMERSFPMSTVARPVTQTPEVDMKSALMKVSGFLDAENGSHRAKAPKRMTPAKLRMKMRAGGRCLDKEVLILK